jgi:hypothetical protein
MDIGQNIGQNTNYPPNIGENKISVLVSDMLVQIYRYRKNIGCENIKGEQ